MDNKNKNPNVPNLRFMNYSNEWKKIKLESLIDEVKDLTSDFEKYPLYSFTIESGVTPKTDRYERGFLVKKDGDLFKIVYPGNFVMNPMNLRFGAINYSKQGVPVSVSGYYDIFNIDDSKYNDFWNAYLKTKKTLNTYNAIATGSLVEKKRVHFSQLKDLKMYVPGCTEKEKINKFLQLLDERINTQNKIIEDYLSLKKCIINELCNNVDEYTECFVSDISNIGRGRVISSKEINKQLNPKYPVYSSQTSNDGIMGYLDQYDFDGEYITWTTDGANAGTVYYRNGKFNCTNVCGTLKINEENDAFFVSKLLSCLTYSYVSRNLANPKLMNNTMAKIKLKLPPLNKQREFANIIRKIEQKMNYEKEMLRLLKTQKEYFLKNLFI